jgi:putative transposase
MPWHTSDLQQQREEFVKRASQGVEYFSTLCRSFGISRTTGYKWLSRYRRGNHSIDALRDLSRRPHNSPTKVPPGVVEQILRLRAERHLALPKYRWPSNRSE